MEALYTKLYDKYNNLKKRRLSELDEINKDQEVKFLNYVTAAEELIQHLKDENERLYAQVSDLRNEVASIRSTKDEQFAEYQDLLTQENHKNKVLSKEVEKLEKTLQEVSCRSKSGKSNNIRPNMLEISPVTSGKVSGQSMRIMTRKRRREARAEMEEGIITPGYSDRGDGVRESAKGSSKGIVSNGDLSNDQQLECCKRAGDKAGGIDIDGNGPTNCQFQVLIECLVGLKLSTINQPEGICISALHQSSGYSFNLTWVKKTAGEEPELIYRVLTLGTFERVAPEWMRSVLMFSMNMCPIFFERVARVIKLHR